MRSKSFLSSASYDPCVHLRLRVPLIPLAELKNDFERIVAYIEEIRVAPFWSLLLTPASSDGICHVAARTQLVAGSVPKYAAPSMKPGNVLMLEDVSFSRWCEIS